MIDARGSAGINLEMQNAIVTIPRSRNGMAATRRAMNRLTSEDCQAF